MTRFHDLQMKTITGDTRSFQEYKGQYCLVVNVASR